MNYPQTRRRALHYDPCRYGQSRINFRGPKRRTNGRYIAFLGGTETYGKFIVAPFIDLTEELLSIPCVNFGCMNAGVDVFLQDPDVMSIAAGAEITVIQVLGAHNMSNRYYRVHPRRNDRFLDPSALMESVFRDVDFAEYHFTRHLLQGIEQRAPDRFSFMREELRSAWMARMQTLIEQLPGKKVLLWFAPHSPPTTPITSADGPEPLFVDAAMLDRLRPMVDGVVQVRLSREARVAGTVGMVFAPHEKQMAAQMLGPQAHDEAARSLIKVLRPLLPNAQKQRPA
ncbi:DUF6473 family protein [Cognatishimia sp. SS12]|uniref:DUF6473 family protein n=1 Tax=Cognatishimia sp. SS12 TaxID=2979465 RepID=UPI00232F9B61|nr:DUF6473 family protein [Cognatishimia sp. SS12]MDC0738420.1 DUF6473 family protein [Cognatishimia sp. SS12]